MGTDGIAAITIINYVQTLKAYIVYRLWCRLGSVGSWSTWIHIGQIRFYAQNLGKKRQGSGIIFTQKRSETLKFCRYIHMVCILCKCFIYFHGSIILLWYSYVNCTDTEVVDTCYCWERENATFIAQDISHGTFHSGNRFEGKTVITDEETGQHIDRFTQRRP